MLPGAVGLATGSGSAALMAWRGNVGDSDALTAIASHMQVVALFKSIDVALRSAALMVRA